MGMTPLGLRYGLEAPSQSWPFFDGGFELRKWEAHPLCPDMFVFLSSVKLPSSTVRLLEHARHSVCNNEAVMEGRSVGEALRVCRDLVHGPEDMAHCSKPKTEERKKAAPAR